MYSVHHICSVYNSLYSVHCTVNILQLTLYNGHFQGSWYTVNFHVQCTSYIVYCTLTIKHCTLKWQLYTDCLKLYTEAHIWLHFLYNRVQYWSKLLILLTIHWLLYAGILACTVTSHPGHPFLWSLKGISQHILKFHK